MKRKPTRDGIPVSSDDGGRAKRRATRGESLAPPVIDDDLTSVTPLDDLQASAADSTRIQRLDELQSSPADSTRIQRLDELQSSPADSTRIQRLEDLSPDPDPQATAILRLEALGDIGEVPVDTTPGVRLAPPVDALDWTSEAPPLTSGPHDATHPGIDASSLFDETTAVGAWPTPTNEPTHPRAEIPAGPGERRSLATSEPDDVTDPRGRGSNADDSPHSPDPEEFAGDVTTPAVSLKELKRRRGAEAPSEGNPAPLLAAGALLCAVVVGVAWLMKGDAKPGRSDLEAIYPYGVHGYVAPDGRWAPSALDVRYTHEGEEPCGGIYTCQVYRYAHQGFSGTMRVRRDGDVWIRVGDKGMPFPIEKPGQGTLEAPAEPTRSRAVSDDEFTR